MLLAEDFLLLVTDGVSGRLTALAAQVDAALGGAKLAGLTLLTKVGLSSEWDRGKPGRLIVRDPSPAGDEVLDVALRIVGAPGPNLSVTPVVARRAAGSTGGAASPPGRCAAPAVTARTRATGSRHPGRPAGQPHSPPKGRPLWPRDLT